MKTIFNDGIDNIDNIDDNVLQTILLNQRTAMLTSRNSNYDDVLVTINS